MTTNELHAILDDENRKLTVGEVQEVINQLKRDCFDEVYKKRNIKDAWKRHYYFGEVNAFYICLDLLEHINYENKE